MQLRIRVLDPSIIYTFSKDKFTLLISIKNLKNGLGKYTGLMQANNVKSLKAIYDNRENLDFDDDGSLIQKDGNPVDFKTAKSPYIK